mmetsp:Transcript_54846/g.160049  ORF Transcript_54846/g.160049 Transcript_54846/m.160049 type:complete len:380 (+) Transcript_54846:80-1219(+)
MPLQQGQEEGDGHGPGDDGAGVGDQQQPGRLLLRGLAEPRHDREVDHRGAGGLQHAHEQHHGAARAAEAPHAAQQHQRAHRGAHDLPQHEHREVGRGGQLLLLRLVGQELGGEHALRGGPERGHGLVDLGAQGDEDAGHGALARVLQRHGQRRQDRLQGLLEAGPPRLGHRVPGEAQGGGQEAGHDRRVEDLLPPLREADGPREDGVADAPPGQDPQGVGHEEQEVHARRECLAALLAVGEQNRQVPQGQHQRQRYREAVWKGDRNHQHPSEARRLPPDHRASKQTIDDGNDAHKGERPYIQKYCQAGVWQDRLEDEAGQVHRGDHLVNRLQCRLRQHACPATVNANAGTGSDSCHGLCRNSREGFPWDCHCGTVQCCA